MTRVSQPIRWWPILLSYLTNKAFLIAVAIGLVWLTIATLFVTERNPTYVANYPDAPRGQLRVNSMDSLTEVRRSGRQDDVDEIDLSNLWYSMSRPDRSNPIDFQKIFPPESFYDILSEFPNLKVVRVQFHDAHTGVAKVAQVKGLKYLHIFSTEFQDLTPLRTLTNLTRLDLLTFKPLTGTNHLRELPELSTLVIGSEDALSITAIDDLASMPHLQTLVLAFSGTNDVKMQPTLNSLARLENSRSLETLYVGGHAQRRGVSLLQKAEAALPKLTVWPALVRRQIPLPMLLVPIFSLGLSVGAMLVNQLRHSSSGVIPNFARRNLQVAAVWMLAGGTLQITLLVLAGYALAALPLTVALASFAMAAILYASFQQQAQTPATLAQLGPFLLGAALAAVLVIPTSANYLRAGNPILLTALLATPLLSFSIGRNAARLLARSEPPALQPRGRAIATVPFKPGWSFATEAREQQIESWPRDRKYWTWWNRVQRWRAGNPPMRRAWLLIASYLWIVLASCFPALFIPQRSSEVVRNQMLLLPVIMMGIVSLGNAQFWLTRLGSLGIESLRPYRRKPLQREWAAALLLDLLPSIAALAVLEAIAVNLTFDPLADSILASWAVNWARVPGDFALVLLGAVPMFAAIAGLLILIQRPWLKILTVSVTITAVTLTTGLLIGMTIENPALRRIDPRAVLVNLWLPALMGSALAWTLYRKWTRIELDRPAQS